MKSTETPNIDRVLSKVGIAEVPDCWRSKWTEAQLAFPGMISGFVNNDIIKIASSVVELPAEFVDVLKEGIAFIQNNEELYRLVWLWYYLIFEDGDREPEWIVGPRKKHQVRLHMATEVWKWPLPSVMPDAISGMFIAVVMLTGVPVMLAEHKRLGIPEKITRDTAYDIVIWAEDYREKFGKWGFANISWMFNHLGGAIFRLGRLEFIPSIYEADYNIFRNHRTGELLALARSGIKFRDDGHLDGTNNIYDSEGSWVSELSINLGRITGNPIMSNGAAVKEPVSISEEEWDVVLKHDVGILDVHIPSGAKMDYDSCIESFKQANEFFPKYFSEHSYVGFYCESWLLDHAFLSILNQNTNIVRFQKEFYMLPVFSGEADTYDRVFGDRTIEISNAPRDTSLQRAIADYVLSGGKMHSAMGFMPADEIGKKHNYYMLETVI